MGACRADASAPAASRVAPSAVPVADPRDASVRRPPKSRVGRSHASDKTRAPGSCRSPLRGVNCCGSKFQLAMFCQPRWESAAGAASHRDTGLSLSDSRLADPTYCAFRKAASSSRGSKLQLAMFCRPRWESPAGAARTGISGCRLRRRRVPDAARHPQPSTGNPDFHYRPPETPSNRRSKQSR